MGRRNDKNLKPISKPRELSGYEKRRRFQREQVEDKGLSEGMAKFLKSGSVRSEQTTSPGSYHNFKSIN